MGLTTAIQQVALQPVVQCSSDLSKNVQSRAQAESPGDVPLTPLIHPEIDARHRSYCAASQLAPSSSQFEGRGAPKLTITVLGCFTTFRRTG
jgi:hypothetical protein